MGSVIKCQVIYDEPFWRNEGLCGQATGDGEGSRVVFDNSPPDGSPGILLAFLEADEARRLSREPADLRRRAVVDSLVRYFGPRAGKPEGYLELDWQQERFSGGCYGTLFGPNVWTRYGHALRTPIGPLHWAGTETATVWSRLHGRRGQVRRARRRRRAGTSDLTGCAATAVGPNPAPPDPPCPARPPHPAAPPLRASAPPGRAAAPPPTARPQSRWPRSQTSHGGRP